MNKLEQKLRDIFKENNNANARNKIGAMVGTLDKESQIELNSICSRIFEEKAKSTSRGEAQENYLCAIRCALSNGDKERAYQILDDQNANGLMRSYANEGIGSPVMEHPYDVIMNLRASGNPECKVINDLLESYFKARGKDIDKYRKPNTISLAENQFLSIMSSSRRR
ncbi:MAG: hypothetical protein Q7S74_04765 [Nanoarchaeota archaeon]|nr:hypothetical protein [Nanoarchaeota archaeon]